MASPLGASYETHHNGGRAFRVTVGAATLHIQRLEAAEGAGAPARTVPFDVLFVGRSPRVAMTEFSGGHGEAFDGNSILYRGPLEDSLEYVHVGCGIRRFRARAPVVEFVSPVGNSDVPYPYAVDADRNTYLLDEGVVLTTPAWRESGCGDPYTYFHRFALVTPDIGSYPPRPPEPPLPAGLDDLEAWWVGPDRLTLRYCPDAAEEYARLAGRAGAAMALRRAGRADREPLTEAGFVGLMRDFGAHRGFEAFAIADA